MSTALITGASNGIGKELAELFAKDNINLVIVARSEDKLVELKTELESAYGISVKVIAKDLSLTESADEVFNELKKSGTEIEYLINNAGYAHCGDYNDVDWGITDNMIRLNIIALAKMTKLFMKPMIERKCGKILNVASIAAFEPGAYFSVYFASKAFVLSFSEAIAVELKGTGVSISALCPGPTKTGFEKRAQMDGSNMFKAIPVMNVKTVATLAYKKFIKKKTIIIPGASNKLIVFATRLAPRGILRKMVGKVNKGSRK